MQRRSFVAQDATGKVLPAATVYVYQPNTTTQATVYSDEGVTAITQPITADSLGRFSFFARGGQYDVAVTYRGNTSTVEDVEFLDNSDLSIATYTSRTAMDAAWSDGLREDGAIVSDGTVLYKASSGSSIVGLPPGLVPYGETSALHWGFVAGADQTDSVATTNRAAIQSAMDWKALQGGGEVSVPAGISKVQPGLDIPSSVYLVGAGVGWFEVIASQNFTWEGTTLVGVGTPHQTKTVYGITNMSHAGGVVTNPDAIGAGFNDDYSLIDLTDQDASGTTPATLTALSYVVAFDGVTRSGMRNIRITHKNDNGDGNPINGFSGTSRTSLGSAIDFGILNLNSKGLHIADCQAFGYFRKAGFAQLLSSKGDDTILQATTFNVYERCVFSGYRGALVRSGDVYPVTARTTTTLEIPWTTSSFWEATGEFTDGSALYSYTGLSQATDKLTFTGVTPDPSGIALNAEIRPAVNFGTAWTVFRDCYIHGLIHQSALIASDNRIGFPYASCAFEVSGAPLRDIELFNCTMFDPQCIIHAHDCGNLDFVGSYAESTSWCQTTPGSTRDGARGARVIAANTSSGGWFGTYRAGGTSLNFDVTTEISANVDMFPVYSRSGVPAFTSGTGLCRPTRITGQPAGQVTGDRRNNSREYNDNTNNLYTGGSLDRLIVRAGSDRASIATIDKDDGIALARGSYTSTTVNIADDAAASVLTPKDGGIAVISVVNFAGFPQGNHSIVLHYDVGSSVQNVKFSGGPNAAAVSTDVTGTTGTDGNTTYGVISGNIRIENRSGAECDYTVTFIS